MRLSFIIIVLQAAAGTLPAQNLVVNPGFEEYYRCPGSWNYKQGDKRIAPGWVSPTSGTPDLFNTCGSREAGVPHNFAGTADARSGNGYAGIYVWNKHREYREYLQAAFARPLQPGRRYSIEFFFRLAPYSRYSIDRIGALLSDSLCCFTYDTRLTSDPTISIVYDSAFRRASGRWERAAGTFTAKGGERFITIGNFSSNNQTRSFHIAFEPPQEAMLATSAYVYVDDVSVTETDMTPESVPAPAEAGPVIVLKNISFAYNRYELLPASFPELDKLVLILGQHPAWTVELTGHTDDVGSEEYNTILSLQRARSCGAYLTSKGIEEARISTVGKGKAVPLVPGTDEISRTTNRRVEARFVDP